MSIDRITLSQERIEELASAAGCLQHSYRNGRTGDGPEGYIISHYKLEKFAESIFNEIITVVAAHVISGSSAMELWKNLHSIYQDQEDE